MAIEHRRKEVGLTQEQLADLASSAFNRVGQLERGLTNPTFSTLLDFSVALEIQPSELLKRYEVALQKLLQ